MNSRYIKLVALVTMTADHIGFMLFPEADWLRIIGRISMPLFCFLIAFGVTKTRSKWKYFLRLFVFALAVQVFFDLFMDYSVFSFDHVWNVFFTLALGVAAASLIDISIKMTMDKGELPLGKFLAMSLIFLSVLAVIIAASIFPVDYGSAGVLLVVLFYAALRHSMLILKITAVASLAVFNVVLYFSMSGWLIQWWAFLALPFILLFSDEKLKISKIEKYAFYVYYPLHFAVIYLISLL